MRFLTTKNMEAVESVVRPEAHDSCAALDIPVIFVNCNMKIKKHPKYKRNSLRCRQ